MGGVPSTPRWGSGTRPQDTAEYLIGTFVGEKSFPLASDYWQKLLELPLDLHWPTERVLKACQLFRHNNCYTRHLAKILVHLAWCFQECSSASDVPSSTLTQALNALYISSVFLKYIIENASSEIAEDLYLSLDEREAVPDEFSRGENIENLLMHSVLGFIGKVDISLKTYTLHCELLNFMLIVMSTQLLFGPSLGPDDIHPFTDAVMAQEYSLVDLVVRRLLLNYVTQPYFQLNSTSYPTFSEGSQSSIFQLVGSATASFVLFPLNIFISSSGKAQRSPLAESSLNILLILIHYRKCLLESMKDRSYGSEALDSFPREKIYFTENPYSKAVENVQDVKYDSIDIEEHAENAPCVRLCFASLFDTLGMCLTDERSVLLLYSLVHGNSEFLEYILVRTDLDTLLMPMLELLYNASRRTSNQIYMVLIIILILSQDSSFNASIHTLMLASVPWYKERRLHQISLGSLMVIILIRTVKYNLSKLRDMYLHTNCLATLANMAPHIHHLNAYASQRLISLFDMLSRKYTKLAALSNDKMQAGNAELREGDSISDDVSTELHIYTDFLRIVLEILNAILTYALPRNPEVVYAIMHRQEVLQPFKSHPRFNELLENIYTVLDFFNSRMDAHKVDGEWSAEKVLEIIMINCRSWRGEGMKMFSQLRFTYEQESHPEEFFIPYVWQLALSHSCLSFDPGRINLFTVDLPVEMNEREETSTHQNV